MFVCNCNGIREGDLRRIAEAGPCTAKSAYAVLGKQPQCGKCVTDAQAILRGERGYA